MVAGNGRLKASKSATRIPVNFTLEECLDIGGKLPAGVYYDSKHAGSKFKAQGCFKSKKYHLGRSNSPIKAGQIYQDFKANPEQWLRERGRI